MRIDKQGFGHTANGERADPYRMTKNSGIYLAVTNPGVTLVELGILDRYDEKADLVFGYDFLIDFQITIKDR